MDSLSSLLNQILGYYCHRMPERLLRCGDATSLLCARCTGVNTGVLLGAAVVWAWQRPRSLGRVSLVVGVALLLLCFADARDTSVVWTTTATTRLLTGLGAGVVLGAWGAALTRGNVAGLRPMVRARWWWGGIVSVAIVVVIVARGRCGWVTLLSVASGVGWVVTHVLVGMIILRRAVALLLVFLREKRLHLSRPHMNNCVEVNTPARRTAIQALSSAS